MIRFWPNTASFWNTEEFKKTAAKNKRNRNSDCRGLGPSLHTAGSISISEHRRRLKEKHGEEPSHAVLFQATHKRKKTNEFVCKKADHVNEAAIQKQQTQPELGESNAWFVAAGGLKKRGSVYGFGSDTPHYFPEAVTQKNSKFGQSLAHAVYEDQIKELKEENMQMKEKMAWLEAEFVAIRGANQPSFQSTNPAVSHGSNGVGLDDLEQ
ncbi:PREDICTED: uncharacterized protein LOC109180813 [Ipomoea nil]|uniref:uncharacterized protein LOC109180813 n=1 Tax=Ipomoea nil TaxID=35883 RepID=UPI000901795D|nr:PREDICTED: uncharacterized protein LOC109180813 [Ipomoea nil]XP_019186066.1 PREDICTED: uncharacterized protein LOC109180813 [Ipomoea nil]XP_019186067.1 PREDICTED: uncharacterized protein LOC109180813 [Ipomoea nil]